MIDHSGQMNNAYLPDEAPPIPKLLLYAFQQILVMFPATVAVALITGFPVSTTIFSCGLATLCFILITRKKVPLFYGSSFAYISAIIGLVTAQGHQAVGSVLPADAIRAAQSGIIASGLVSVLAGIIVKLSGTRFVEKLLPPQVTGAISIVIGLSLAANAMTDIAPSGTDNWLVWLVAMLTFLSTVLIATYCKSIAAQLPLLLGILIGCGSAAIIFWISGKEYNLFRSISDDVFASSLWKLGDGSVFALPSFTIPRFSMEAVIAIMPMAFATIPESVAHMYQLDIYVNELARKKGSPTSYKIKEMLGENLIGDGCSDIVCGLIGGPAGTSYGENMSAMLISRVFSISVLVIASVIAMILSCFTPLIKMIYCIPLAVIGGLEIYLFGAIAVQGIAILIQNRCDIFSTQNVAVIASILIIGLGGSYAYNGTILFLGTSIPVIAGSAIFGIILNLLLNISQLKSKK